MKEISLSVQSRNIAANGLPPCDVAAKRTDFSPLKITFLRENQTSGKEKPAMIA